MPKLRTTLAAGLLLAAPGAAAADAQAVFLKDLKADATLKNAFLQAAGYPDPANWALTDVKFRLKASAIRLKLPPAKLEYVTSHEILNCEDTAVSQAITLSKEVSNKLSATVERTVETNDELNLSIEYEGIGGGWSGSRKVAASTTTAQEQSVTQKIEETTTVAFDKRGGRISVLQAMKLEATRVPWTAAIVPDDNEKVYVTAAWTGPARVCLYEHVNYGGGEECFDAPAQQGRMGLKWNNKVSSIKVTGHATFMTYRLVNFGGESRGFGSSTANVGEWNDRMSSFKFEKRVVGASPLFSAVKAAIPEAKRTFTASGTISVSENRTDGKRITNYAVSETDLARACAATPALTMAADSKGGKAPAKPAGRGLVRKELPKEEAMRRIVNAPKI
jgi:hypothetical protein